MSAYVESVLATGENVVYRAALSNWKFFSSYAGGILLFVAGAAVLYLAPFESSQVSRMVGAGLLAVSVVVLLSAIIRQRTTELVLTDRRIIAKRGIVSRETVEMNLAKVESLQVRQGLLGRMLDFGDVAVVGTGSSLEPLRGISNPLELRKKLGELADLPVLK